VFFVKQEGRAHSDASVYMWKPGDLEPRLLIRADASFVSCQAAASEVICSYETPTQPREVIALDAQSGSIRPIYNPNASFSDLRLPKIERIFFPDGFGNAAFGHLVYPPDYDPGHKYPLVIVQYRSKGFLRGGVGDEYPIYPLAAHGAFVLSYDQPNDWRILSDHGVKNLADVASLFGAEYKNDYIDKRGMGALKNAIAMLTARNLIDPRKVGITGLSDGARQTDYAISHSDIFAAAAHSGFWFPEFYSLIVNSSYREVFKGQMGTRGRQATIDRFKQISISSTHPERIHTPLLLQDADTELIGELPEYTALVEAKRPVDAYVFPNEYHVKWQPKHKLAVAERAIDWFDFWLQGREDSAPSKREQYEHWEQLCDMQIAEKTGRSTFCIPSHR
jgi:hypothetical protein